MLLAGSSFGACADGSISSTARMLIT
jgi:hypothetical protein